MGGKLCIVLDNVGRVVAWDCETANVHDSRFAHLIERLEGQTIVLGDAPTTASAPGANG